MTEERPENKRKRKKAKIEPWTQREINILIKEYESGKQRGEIMNLLNRSTGSVANKIRLLIKAGILERRR